LLLAGAILLLVGLGRTDLWAPDEPRYARVAEEMLTMDHGARGLVVLHLNDVPYTQKPPLYYWLAALASLPGGEVSEISARLPSALAGLGALLVTWCLGARLFGPRVATWSAALLLTVFDFAFLARRARLDVTLTLWVTLASLAFWRLDRGIGARRWNVVLLHGAMGLGLLTKGPVALLPLLVAAVYLAWERRLGDLRRAVPIWSPLLSIAPGLAWITAAVVLTPSGFFDEAVVENLYGRFFLGTSHEEPFYYYLYQFPFNFLPWTLLWPLLILELRRRAQQPPDARRATPSWRFLLAWVATYFVFFSLSTGKRGLYLLPAFPASALLCGAALEASLARSRELPRWLERTVLALLCAVAVAGLALSSGIRIPDHEAVWVPGSFGIALAALGLAGMAAWRGLPRRRAPPGARVAACIAAVGMVELCVFTLFLPAFDPEKSPRPIAEQAAALAGPGQPIGLYGNAAIVGGLAFYSKRRVVQLIHWRDIWDFLDQGGRVVATKRSYANLVKRVAPIDVRVVQRSGKRSYVLMTPSP
jgi:4-amino-4-deoxy-L-arabinose transferase-like glycosyltransferase